MDTPLVFRVPLRRKLLESLHVGGFSFLKCNENMTVAYQPNHWRSGKLGRVGIALRSDMGLNPISEQSRQMMQLYAEAPSATRRSFLKGMLGLGLGALGIRGKKHGPSPHTSDAAAGYHLDTSDAGAYYSDTSDASGYYLDTSDASYYTGAAHNEASVIIDLDDLNDALNRHLTFSYEQAIIETVGACEKLTVSPGTDIKVETLQRGLNESRLADGRFKILLDEADHIEWSVMNKLLKIYDSNVRQRPWTSPIEKLMTLCSESRGGLLRGVSANEALTVGGDKHIMWVDIDSTDVKGINEWLDSQPFFPSDSYVRTSSSTGKCHLFVATDKPLKERWQRGMRKMLRDSMPVALAHKLDRVYGPESRRAIFLPRESMLHAALPQYLIKRASGVFDIPTLEVEHCLWKKR